MQPCVVLILKSLRKLLKDRICTILHFLCFATKTGRTTHQNCSKEQARTKQMQDITSALGVAQKVAHRVWVCVCVSHPGSKGFPPFLLSSTTEAVSIFPLMQGARRLISHPCQRSYGNQLEESWDAGSCTCQELLLTLSTHLVCFHGVSCLPSLKQVSHRTVQQLEPCTFTARVKLLLNNTSHRTLSPCCSITFLPNVAIESN